jgi:hypothetical protein
MKNRKLKQLQAENATLIMVRDELKALILKVQSSAFATK